MDGQDGDRVGVGIELGGGWIVAGIDERCKVRGDEDGAVVDQKGRPGSDDLKEARDVLELLLGRRRVRRDELGEQATRLEEPIQQLACGEVVGGLGVPAQSADQPGHGGARLGGDAQDPWLSIELLEDRPHRAVPAAGHVDDRGQVLAAEAIHLGCRQRV